MIAAKRLRRGTVVVEAGSELYEKTVRIAKEMNVSRKIDVFFSNSINVPMITGFFRPVVLLPKNHETWSDEDATSILRHEISHIRRRDPVWLLASQIACSVCWFQPLARFAARQLQIERELACDDVVVLLGIKPKNYATLLLQFAREQYRFGGPLVVPMSRKHQIEKRIDAILDVKKDRSALNRKTAYGLFAGIMILVVLGGLFSPFSPRTAAVADTDTPPEPVITSDSAAPETVATTVLTSKNFTLKSVLEQWSKKTHGFFNKTNKSTDKMKSERIHTLVVNSYFKLDRSDLSAEQKTEIKSELVRLLQAIEDPAIRGSEMLNLVYCTKDRDGKPILSKNDVKLESPYKEVAESYEEAVRLQSEGKKSLSFTPPRLENEAIEMTLDQLREKSVITRFIICKLAELSYDYSAWLKEEPTVILFGDNSPYSLNTTHDQGEQMISSTIAELVRKKEYDKAFQWVVDTAPHYRNNHVFMGTYLYFLVENGEVDKAIMDAEKFKNNDIELRLANLYLLRILISLGYTDQARKYINDKALWNRDGIDYLCFLNLKNYAEAGKTDDALSFADEILSHRHTPESLVGNNSPHTVLPYIVRLQATAGNREKAEATAAMIRKNVEEFLKNDMHLYSERKTNCTHILAEIDAALGD